jgi:hypothetical protein
MAVDTRDKRFSFLGFHLPQDWMMANPDGTIAKPDRAQLLRLYPGIALAMLPEDASVGGGALDDITSLT